MFIVARVIQSSFCTFLRLGEQAFASHAQRVVDQDDGRARGAVVFRGAAATEKWARERDNDQQNRKTAQQQQQQVVQCATTNGALRHLANKHEGRELDATRTCATHEMHENGRRERRDAEKK